MPGPVSSTYKGHKNNSPIVPGYMLDEFKGHADIVYSPDDGGWWAELLWDRNAKSPIFSTAKKAIKWAAKRGATNFHEIS